jgi:hypothetical protein
MNEADKAALAGRASLLVLIVNFAILRKCCCVSFRVHEHSFSLDKVISKETNASEIKLPKPHYSS